MSNRLSYRIKQQNGHTLPVLGILYSTAVLEVSWWIKFVEQDCQQPVFPAIDSDFPKIKPAQRPADGVAEMVARKSI